jgi:hypothetical protein
MRIQDPAEYISLGARLRYLVGANKTFTLLGEGHILENLKILPNKMSQLGFDVSKSLFDFKMQSIQDDLQAKVDSEGKGAKLGDEKVLFSRVARQLEDSVLAEAATLLIAVPSKRRIPISQLLQESSSILGRGVYVGLTSIAKSDWDGSCKCLAFECATASAFHALRCLEECVRTTYRAYFKSKKVGKKAWGTLTEELKSKPRAPHPDEDLLKHLDHIRRRFRNPTDHPDKSYDVEEAEDLLHLAADAINRCMRDPRVVANRE